MKKYDGSRIKELLSNYYEINGKTATIDLYYDSFEELVNQNFGKDSVNMLSDKLFDDILQAIDILPKKYDMQIRINIRDFGQFSEEQAKAILENNLLLKFYSIGLNRYRRNRQSLSMIGIGAAALIASYIVNRLYSTGIIYDIVNISGTLFIWEGVALMFIEGNSYRKEFVRILKKVKKITLFGPGLSGCDVHIQRIRDLK